MAEERNNEQQENLQEQENLTEQEENQTKNELLLTLAEDFSKYYQQNKDKFKNSSLTDIFFQFLENQQENQLIKTLEKKLGRRLTFDDIKNLYLNSYYTLEETLTKDIFKKFKRKNIIKSIIKKFEEKINEKLGEKKVDFSQFLPENISNENQIDEIFSKIKEYLHTHLSKEEKESIKNTKITNEAIINKAIEDGIFSSQEAQILKGEISQEILTINEDLQNTLEVLLNSNLVNTINEIKQAWTEVSADFDRLKKIPKLSDIIENLRENLTLSQEDKEKLWENINQNPEYNQQITNELKNCENPDKIAQNYCIENIKNKFIEKYLEDINNLIDFLEEKQDEKAILLKKLATNQPLTPEEEKQIVNLLKEKSIENTANKVSIIFNLTEDEKNKYKEYLEQLVDENTSVLKINNIEFPVNKQFSLERDNEDFLNSSLTVKFELTGDEIKNLSHIFPNYFTSINGQDYSIFTKRKIKTKTGEEIIGYIGNGLKKDEIEIYSNYEEALKGENPIKIIKESDIENIENQEEEKLILTTANNLAKLSLLGLNNFPNKQIDTTTFLISNTLEEIKSEEQNNKLEKNNLEEFKKEWKTLEGDTNLDFKVGVVISFKGTSLNLPGIKSNWYHGEIIEINQDLGTFKIRFFGGLLTLEGEKEIEIPLSKDTLEQLKLAYYGNVFRFEKLDTANKFTDYINNLSLKSDHLGFNSTLEKWKNSNLSFKNGKLFKKTASGKEEEITKIGKINLPGINTNEAVESLQKGDKKLSDFYFSYNISFKSNKVILTHPYDKNFKKEIDYNTFLNIILNNQLEPWTEEEFKSTEQDYTHKAQVKEKAFKRFAIVDIITSVKQIKNNFVYHFKEDDELRASEMYEKLAGKLPPIWFLRDIKLEASHERESKIWKRIQNAKSFLEMTGDDKGGLHAKGAANIIKDEIFSKVEKNRQLSRREQLKAAGYLLYALDKGPGPYFRGIGDYEGKGMRIKALLGEDHFNKWQNKNNELIKQIEKDPGNQLLRDQLVKSELFYIKDTPELGNLYSNNFGSTLEGAAINVVGDLGKAKNVYEGESNKGSFALIYDGLKSYILNNRPANSIGALQAISERVEDEQNYIDYYKVILMFHLTGFAYNTYGTPYREEFEKLCRTYGIPLGLFTFDFYGINKTLRIFDYIVKTKGIKPGGKGQSFTKYLFDTDNPDSIVITDLLGKGQRQKIISKLENFWALYGNEIVNIFDYTDTTLLKYNELEEDEKTKQALEEYFSNVNWKGTGEKWEIDSNLFKTAYAPYYKNGIFNLGSSAFSKIALNIDEGDFDGEIKGIAKGVWTGLINRLDNFKDIAKKDTNIYKFILKKYLLWFGRAYEKLGPDNKKYKLWFAKALLEGNKEQLKELIVNLNKNFLGGHHGIPPEIENGLNKFTEVLFLEKISEPFKDSIKNVLEIEEDEVKDLNWENFNKEELDDISRELTLEEILENQLNKIENFIGKEKTKIIRKLINEKNLDKLEKKVNQINESYKKLNPDKKELVNISDLINIIKELS